MTLRKQRGFSLLEMMTVIAIGFILAGCTFVALMPVLKEDHVDQAYDTLLSVMRTYRNQSITQSKRYVLTFTAGTPSTITVAYWGYAAPPATSPAPVTLYSYTMPTDIQFITQSQFPNPGPDSIGTGGTAIVFNACTVLETGNPCVIFYPDGSAQDDAGNYNTGLVYISRPGDLYSARAVDVFGTTGRIRGWRLYNQGGTNVWEQQ